MFLKKKFRTEQSEEKRQLMRLPQKNALFSDFRTLCDFADPNHLLPTGKSSGKSK